MFTINDKKLLKITNWVKRFIDLSIREVEAQLIEGWEGDGHQEWLNTAPVHEIGGVLISRNR